MYIYIYKINNDKNIYYQSISHIKKEIHVSIYMYNEKYTYIYIYKYVYTLKVQNGIRKKYICHGEELVDDS